MPEPRTTWDPNQVVMVNVVDINVPQERVTAVFDADLEKEFEASIKSKGILEPIRLLDIDGELWLTDGLHRIQEAEKLGIPQVRALVKKGTVDDLLIENLISIRQRGKSNPAQEADVLAYLVNVRKFPLENASAQLGLSLDWARKLLKISRLPDEIKDMLKAGLIPVTGAFYLVDLENPLEQISVAKDAASYEYTAFQIKARVTQLLNPDVEPEPGGVTFTQNGRPQRIPIRCRFCGDELPDVGKQYVWVCTGCEALAADMLKTYREEIKKTALTGGE